MRKRSTTLAVVGFLFAVMGCWILFVASFSAHELLLGAAFTIFSIAVSALAWRELSVRFSPSIKQLALLWRIPGYVLRDSYEVSLILIKDMLHIRRAASLFRAAPFSPRPSKHGDAQVVLAITGTTMTPSIIILGCADQRLLLHQLECSGVPQMLKDLEANP